MKLSVMRPSVMKLSKVALAAALMFAVSGLAVAQDRDHDGWREGSNHEERSEAYQDGFRAGQFDRVHSRGYKIPNHGKHWEDQAYREAYIHGYREGYGYGRDGDNDRDDGAAYRREPVPSAGWGRPAPGPMGNQPFQIGYQDGYSQGLGDRNNGHSFRPTAHGYYSDGDHGYSSTWGDKSQYRTQYRQGYLSGYQRGYNGR
ncbi:MAG TPA: hypothetical protein VE998_02525 [Terriglobales bacterium]|nr:hypothetical protein [Terriglobales bacterium]